jgi:hypothetical protein
MPMLVVYTYVYKIWRGLLSIIKWRRYGNTLRSDNSGSFTLFLCTEISKL